MKVKTQVKAGFDWVNDFEGSLAKMKKMIEDNLKTE